MLGRHGQAPAFEHQQVQRRGRARPALRGEAVVAEFVEARQRRGVAAAQRVEGFQGQVQVVGAGRAADGQQRMNIPGQSAALLFLWRQLGEAGIQARVSGEVVQVDDAEADAYFASRARMSQLGAWASRQSATLESREAFDARLAEVEAEFDGRQVPRPDGWSGFRVLPSSLEFWHGAGFRLHERWRYDRAGDGCWSKRMLFP